MKRDTTELPTSADCYHIQDDKTLLVQDETTETKYVLLSDKWTFSSSDPLPTQSTEGYACMTYSEVQDIPSYYDFITPIYYTIALATSLFIFWISYRLILYPFFRTKI